MIAARRTRWSFGLQRAVEHACALGRPLVVLEPLRVDYPHASARFHRFILDGMADQTRAFDGTPVTYYPYVEPAPGHGHGLLAALASRACVVVTDDFPAFFLRRMVAAAARRLDVRLEVVDGHGLLPLAATDRPYPTAHGFRRHLQRILRDHLPHRPLAEPLDSLDLPPLRPRMLTPLLDRWPRALPALLDGDPVAVAAQPIDHAVAPVAGIRGGQEAAAGALDRWLARGLDRYLEDRNHPDRRGASELSAWLHFGHLSAAEAVWSVLDGHLWTPGHLSTRTDGSRSGWWGLPPAAEAWLDQLVTWRELGFVFCHHTPDHASYDSLPAWARATLEEHAGDERPWVYSRDALERADTHDELWNAAQTQLATEGRIHTYLRMLWGKRILEWSAHPRDALATMLYLNDRYALDGRDPNTIAGVTWILGRFDRAWGPERPIFGKVRYMSSANTRRKVKLSAWLARHAAARG